MVTIFGMNWQKLAYLPSFCGIPQRMRGSQDGCMC